MKLWIENFTDDFRTASREILTMLDVIINRMETSPKPIYANLGVQLRQIIGAKVRDNGNKFLGKPPDPLQCDIKFYTIMDVIPAEFARQLTLIEFSIFESIKFEECFGLGWVKKANASKSPNIIKMISQFNKVFI